LLISNSFTWLLPSIALVKYFDLHISSITNWLSKNKNISYDDRIEYYVYHFPTITTVNTED
jgi:hypothetical protein